MAKENSEVKGLEIPIHFHNYKLLKDKSFVLKGSHVYFVQGPNGVGKTSFLKALTSLQTASDDTVDKVSRGESEGSYEAVIPAADGSMITIRHEFTDNNKGKFIAIKEDGTKVSSVTEIRSLFNYTPIDVDQFFAMSNTANGRRQQRDIILKLLPEDMQAKYKEFDLQESHYYDQRTKYNVELESVNKTIQSIGIAEDDESLLTKKEEAESLIKKYQSVKDAKVKLSYQNIAIDQLKERRERLIGELENLNKDIETKESELVKLNSNLPDLTIDELDAKLEKGNDMLSKIISIQSNKSLIERNASKAAELDKSSKELTEKIEHCRKMKNEIVSESELPVENISFEDGYLTIDGFQFKENQVCESDAVLILANILAKINPGPIQVIGDASILDNAKLEKLHKIAEANNKILFVDEVVRNANDIYIVGYEDVMERNLEDAFKKVGAKQAVAPKVNTPKESFTPNPEFEKKNDDEADALF